ncbi:MAG: segregation/condensation protein A [Ruthenibacterium sp.]
MEALTFKMEEFEGPLDLLLALIAKNKMNIYDINISALIDQYLAVVDLTEAYRMEAASEFIEMAARLVQMKSYFLLPRSDEGERMREELTGMLVEYSLCKTVAAKLRVMADGVYTAVREPAVVDLDERYHHRHELYELETAYNNLQGRSLRKRQPAQERFDSIVQAPFVSVTSRIIHVLRGLMTGRVQHLCELFTLKSGRSATVATFLAVLELIRAGRITIDASETMHVNKETRRSREIAEEAEAWS